MQIDMAQVEMVNSRILDMLRIVIQAKGSDATDPTGFAMNLLESALQDEGLKKTMAVTLLGAILHHSLKKVTMEKFLAEMEPALRDYSAFALHLTR